MQFIHYLTLQIGNVRFLFILLLGLLGISILCLYDYFVLKAINLTKNMSSFRIFKISFMTNTLNMVLGFGGFIGAGLRYYMYKPYTKNGKTLVTAIGMILISMLSGISLLSIFVVLNVFINIDGKAFVWIQKSSGSPRLDAAGRKAVLKTKFRKKTLKGFVVNANSLLIVLLKYENNKTATEKML